MRDVYDSKFLRADRGISLFCPGDLLIFAPGDGDDQASQFIRITALTSGLLAFNIIKGFLVPAIQ